MNTFGFTVQSSCIVSEQFSGLLRLELTARRGVLDKPPVARIVKKFLTCYGIAGFVTLKQQPNICPYLCVMKPT
jgi:hypothetical protein